MGGVNALEAVTLRKARGISDTPEDTSPQVRQDQKQALSPAACAADQSKRRRPAPDEGSQPSPQPGKPGALTRGCRPDLWRCRIGAWVSTGLFPAVPRGSPHNLARVWHGRVVEQHGKLFQVVRDHDLSEASGDGHDLWPSRCPKILRVGVIGRSAAATLSAAPSSLINTTSSSLRRLTPRYRSGSSASQKSSKSGRALPRCGLRRLAEESFTAWSSRGGSCARACFAGAQGTRRGVVACPFP